MPNRLLTRAIRALFHESLIRFHGPARRNVVALTFDDGPNLTITPRVLELLAERQHTATFFVLGREAERHPEILKSIVSSGCELGNHLFSHQPLEGMPFCLAIEELKRTERLIARWVPDPPFWFRPPFGRLTLRFCLHLWRRPKRRQPVLWSVLVPHEHSVPPAEALRVLEQSNIKAGDIVLLHDDNPAVVSILPGLLGILESRGLRSVTLTDLFEAR